MLNASKWATITEIAAKVTVPITNMVLARLLLPEAFGVVATITMIISFVEMFTDSGFQKYLIQREFQDDTEKYKYANVAFWTNFVLSILLWIIISIFCEPIAILVGSPGLGIVIMVAGIQLPLTSFSSIQMALYKRDFDFKSLFMARIVSVCIPFVVTIPLAYIGFSYWALIVGAICSQLSNAIILSIKSKWKPMLFYHWATLKKMLSFSIWSLIEAISVWVSAWADTLIISSVLNSYYLGLYKTSTTMVSGLMAIITSATVPVLFSALSRLQNNNEQFIELFLKIQKIVSIVVFPLGIGVYLFSDIATNVLLGSQWNEASGVIGHWALTTAIMIIYGHFSSEVYRAKGRPKLSLLAQILHLVVLIPVCIISAKYGFWILVFARCWIRLQFVLVHFLILKLSMGISITRILQNTFPTAFSSVAMGAIGYFLLLQNNGLLWSFISIIACVCLYFGFLYLFPTMRKELATAAGRFVKNRALKYSAKDA